MLTRPKGTRDFYPHDMRAQRWLLDLWRRCSERFGFEEFDGPSFEHIELYTTKSGQEIVGQLYDFKDKGDRHLALRPEMTPTLARMVAAKAQSLAKPMKWYSIPRCYRYERMQRGRLREFFQWNLDILGSNSIHTDAELIAAVVFFLQEAGLDERDVQVHISSRDLITAFLLQQNIPETDHAGILAAMDKLSKTAEDKKLTLLTDSNVPAKTAEALIELLTIKDLDSLPDALKSTAEFDSLRQLFEVLDNLGITSFCHFDAGIVRGLAYYTGIIFEVLDVQGELRAICGGGRYDGLIEMFGGPAMPAVGFGLGDAVITELLARKNVTTNNTPDNSMYIAWLSDQDYAYACKVAQHLRNQGINIDMALSTMKPARYFKHAESKNIRKILFIGESERQQEQVRVKDLLSGQEESIDYKQLAAT